jgi:SAM-dependent methyltransferase
MTDGREIAYLSAPADVRMGNRWFEIAALDHFWVRRRFDVVKRMIAPRIAAAREMAEIGCGNGLLQRQIEGAFGRDVTGFDLNDVALRQNVSRRSPLYYYDIHERRAEFRARFDVIFLFDVIEHIVDEQAFLDAVRFHLAPGGALIVNVPAGNWAFSPYDVAAGHVRRYDAASLRASAASAGFAMGAWTYWGLPLAPSLLLRRLWLMGRTNHDEILSAGFGTRNETVNTLMGALARCEWIPQHLLGTSLLAVFQEQTRRDVGT